jgi:hypothetical protein
MKSIPNEQLRTEDLPSSDADWGAIQAFALTFDGYRHWGSTAALESAGPGQEELL